MAITQTITALPTAPNPSTMTRDQFSTAAAAFVLAQVAEVTELNTWATQANTLASSLNALAAGTAIGIPYTFSTTTTDADPGAGFLRLDNATQNTATTIRTDLSGNDGSVWTDVLNTLDDSTSTIKGHIRLVKNGDATKWLLFTVSALASPTGYKNITVANVASSAASPFANNDNIIMEFTRTGDKGDPGTPGTSTITLAENVGVELDTALSADGKWCGIIEAGTLGATIAFGEVCYLAAATSKWLKAKADVATTSAAKLGVCLVAGNDTSATTMLLYGKVRADALYPTMTIAAPVYISAATAGMITSTAPTGTTDFVVRKIGSANTADELFFNPSNDYITLA